MNPFIIERLSSDHRESLDRQAARDHLAAQARLARSEIRARQAEDPHRSAAARVVMRLLIATGASLTLMLMAMAPVAASEGRGSCATFGTVTAGLAPGGGLGAIISSAAPASPRVVSGVVLSEHATMCGG